ncbi:MAG: polysaccharide biosynthesis tyrosine autokinase [Anaerolineae bacterium]|nr:polysaccharide biosynthesis tyrosine autokinase [Anaerolineae bacterium]
MELLTYLKILWKRKWLIILPLVLAVAVVLLLARQMPATYSAMATMRVETTRAGALDNVDYDIFYTERLVSTYVELATSRPVLEELAETLELERLPGIEVEIAYGTELFYIHVTDTNPVRARVVANTLADILVRSSTDGQTLSGPSPAQLLQQQMILMQTELEQARAEYIQLLLEQPDTPGVLETTQRAIDARESVYYDLLRQYERMRVTEAVRSGGITLVEAAVTPESASGPNQTLYLLLAVAGGLGAGVTLAFVFEVLDTRLMTTEAIVESSRLPLLGEVPHLDSAQDGRMAAAHFPGADIYRRLATSIFSHQQDQDSAQTLLISSAEPGEGKSFVAANLAYSLAQSGQKTVVIDGDLWVPTLHEVFHLENKKGLADVLAGKSAWKTALQPGGVENLQVLTSGPTPDDPAALIGADGIRALLEELAKAYDAVVLDSPALLGVADAAILAPLVERVVMVVYRGRSKHGPLQEALRQLDMMNVQPAGVIVNGAKPLSQRYYSYYQARARAARPQGAAPPEAK